MDATRPVHGSLDVAELRALGLDPSQVIDFSASLNPLGTAPAVRQAIAAVDPSVYPDRDCTTLRQALAAHTGLPTTQILPGNGSTELIHLAARAFLRPDDVTVLFPPTFSEYEAACRNAAASIHRLATGEAEGFRWPARTALDALRRLRPAAVFLCNPNNPTGVQLSVADVRAMAMAIDGLLIVDEAYAPLADLQEDTTSLLSLGNVALIRSMTKDHGLAGLRLGYMLAPAAFIDRVAPLQPTWSVNAVAQAAGVAALGCPEHIAAGREAVRQGKTLLDRELRGLGLAPLPSSANFLLVKVGDGAALRRKLLLRGMCVRDCASFGLPEYVRIGVRRLEDCQRLISELREVLGRLPPNPHRR